MLINTIIEKLDGLYSSFKTAVPAEYMPFFSIAFFTILITLYVLFVWKFHKFLAKRDLLELNLSQYNRVDHPFFKKTVALFLFLAEYIVILPIIVFFWFVVMALIFIFLARDHGIEQIILISACIIGAIRITSYYHQELSIELAKIFPFTILIISLTSANFFDISSFITKIASIPSVLTNVLIYLFFIITIEFVMRLLYIITNYHKLDN